MKKNKILISIFLFIYIFIFGYSSLNAYEISATTNKNLILDIVQKKNNTLNKFKSKGIKYVKTLDSFVEKYKEDENILTILSTRINSIYENKNQSVKTLLDYLLRRVNFSLYNIEVKKNNLNTNTSSGITKKDNNIFTPNLGGGGGGGGSSSNAGGGGGNTSGNSTSITSPITSSGTTTQTGVIDNTGTTNNGSTSTGTITQTGVIDNTGTTNTIFNNPYLETVLLPDCNINNPEVQFINSNSDWSHINDNNKSIFCVSPGNYSSSGVINIKTSGTINKKKYIVLNNGNDIHPGKLNKNQLAKVNFYLKDSNYWVIDRMSFWDSTGSVNPITLDNSDNNIINRYFMDNVANGIYLNPGSDNNTIQNSRIQKDDINIHLDRAAIGLNSNSNHNANAVVNITNTKIINNEIYNFVDGFQAIRSGWYESGVLVYTKNINYEGTIVDSNIIYIDDKVYTDCNGNHDINGTCAYAENAIDLKVGSSNPNNPMIITNNKMWGYRKADSTNSDLSDPGATVVGHYDVSNLIFKDNILSDSTVGLAVNNPMSTYAMNNAKFTGNIFNNMHSYELDVSNTTNSVFDNNLFKDFINPSVIYTYWGLSYNSIGNTFSNNIITNAAPRKYRFRDYINQNTFSGNLLYNTLRGDLPISGNDIITYDPTITFSDLEITYDNFTNNPLHKIFYKVKQ